jgi:hypothetical protein
LKLLHAQATVYPGGLSDGARNGEFTIGNVPAGDSVTVVVEGVERLPVRITFLATRDTTLEVSLGVDSVALRMTAKQIERLAARARTIPHSVDELNGDAIRNSGSGTMDELLRRRLPTSMFSSRPPYAPVGPMCILYNDREVSWFALQGMEPAQIERVEVYGFRAKMIRVYSRPYVISLMRREKLPPMFLGDYGMGRVCS